MNGKTAKLLRRVAKTNVYDVANFKPEIKYMKHNVRGNVVLASECLRTSYKYLKKSYRNGDFTTKTLREELARHALESVETNG